MLLQRRSLSTNIVIMAAVIGIPYAFLWGYLLYTGRIGLDIMAGVVVLLVFDAAVLFWFVRGLVMPLHTVSAVMHRVAEGDFTADVVNPYGGQIGQMLENVRFSVHANREMMENILANTVDIASSSFETVHASAKVVFNVEEEENHVLSISDAVRQITDTVGSSAEAASNAHDVAQSVNEEVGNGNVVVKQSIDSMSQLADTVGDAAGKVEKLGESSKRIGEITEVINDIAEQTNLLALNAAIEAARAGEHGRGFAVVADEVRSLAERTSKATHEIDQMIHTIQAETSGVIETMRTGVERAESGKEAALRSGQAFDAISQGIDEVTGLIAQIASASEQQRVSTQEIAESIQVIAKISTGNTQQANQAVDIIQRMNEVINNQLKTLDAYQIPHKALLVAKSDHMLWKKRLTEVVLGRTRMESSEVSDDHSCRFGKWYFSEGQEKYGYKETFKAIQDPHREIHATAKRVIELYNQGDHAGAQELLDGLSVPTGQVLENLDRVLEDAKTEETAIARKGAAK